MLNSFAIIMTLIIDNPEMNEELNELLDTHFWTLCEYSYSLFHGITISAPINVKEQNDKKNQKLIGKN